MTAAFEPTKESLERHETPKWFHDAKFGIFLHWGPYSIPAFAPVPDPDNPREAMDFADQMKFNPYAEWYLNTMLFEDGPTARHHAETYGADYAYDNFGAAFNEALQGWDPAAWADLFKASGAGYVVLVTKHHDGFTLWPSAHENPSKQNWAATRDIPGELAEAVRAAGLKFGVYYSGGIDWTFRHKRLDTITDFFGTMPGDAENYTAYAEAQMRELIDRYKPDYLWNDIGFPDKETFWRILAHYYNEVPDGLTNDRWISPAELLTMTAEDWTPPEGVEGIVPPRPSVCDVRTPEYSRISRILPFDWEMTRGMTHAFGHNKMDSEATTLSTDEIIEMISAAACFGGNVLLNAAVMGDTRIEPLQATRLLEVGKWLEENGDAVRQTRPVPLAETKWQGHTLGATKAEDGTLYIHIQGKPEAPDLTLDFGETPPRFTGASLFGTAVESFDLEGRTLTLRGISWAEAPVQIIRLTV